MREMTANESMNINGGKTYHCPFGCNKSGNYISVYTHCLLNGCFKKDPWLNGLWIAAKCCYTASNFLKGLKTLLTTSGKHFK